MTMIPNESHAQAQELSMEAERLMRSGHTQEAINLYHSAAGFELEALLQVPENQPRTRGILAVSSSSLYYKASEFEAAEKLCHGLLANDSLPSFAREQLQQVLEASWHGQWLTSSNRELSQEIIVVSLRGRAIGTGLAPLAMVTEKINGINSLLFRITEFLGDFDFRTKGPPSDAVRQLCQPVVSEPQPGSYRFSIRLAHPQLELLPVRRVQPQQITSKLIDLVRTISPHSAVILRESVEEVVPDSRYRDAMLKLVRNLTPDGVRLREMEFATGGEGRPARAVLHAGARSRIDEHVRRQGGRGDSDTLTGTLRALDLDKSYFQVTSADGQRTRIRIRTDVLDDVIGPMVNKQVVATGRWTPSKRFFILEDVELDSASDERM